MYPNGNYEWLFDLLGRTYFWIFPLLVFLVILFLLIERYKQKKEEAEP